METQYLEDHIFSVFSYPNVVVALRFDNRKAVMRIQTAEAKDNRQAVLRALRRIRAVDPKGTRRMFGRFIGADIFPDTPEGRSQAGIDDTPYWTFFERQGFYPPETISLDELKEYINAA